MTSSDSRTEQFAAMACGKCARVGTPVTTWPMKGRRALRGCSYARGGARPVAATAGRPSRWEDAGKGLRRPSSAGTKKSGHATSAGSIESARSRTWWGPVATVMPTDGCSECSASCCTDSAASRRCAPPRAIRIARLNSRGEHASSTAVAMAMQTAADAETRVEDRRMDNVVIRTRNTYDTSQRQWGQRILANAEVDSNKWRS